MLGPWGWTHSSCVIGVKGAFHMPFWCRISEIVRMAGGTQLIFSCMDVRRANFQQLVYESNDIRDGAVYELAISNSYKYV